MPTTLEKFSSKQLAALTGGAIPGDTRNSFALLNWLCISATAVMLALSVLKAGASRQAAVIAGLLMILSVPTFWYAPYLLTDHTVLTALQDVRSLASLATAVGLVLPLALLGMRQSAPALRPLKSLMLLMVLPPLYAALCVRVDGRAIWGLYPMLVPFAAIYCAAWLERRKAAP